MNIAQAKEELCCTVQTYLAKNEDGSYRIPRVRQRPVLLMGPPGIGKTAIMEQVAKLCKVGLVAYTMTHHTRQSAIGLPVVEKRWFDGKEYTVTEYTMSEIIASVYETMEHTGCKEGILFLDEINCVSETLAPVMLQFLQNKSFGNHKLPDGWIIAAAGNPKDYNKSAREFDVATLDRVRRMQIEPDFAAWKQYALHAGIHGSILSYLQCHPHSFYHIRQTAEGMEFVTARGWEDLSVILQEYEHQKISVSQEMIGEYLTCETIAEDFYAQYQMTQEYKKYCPLDKILDGTLSKQEREQLKEHLCHASKEETFTISGWFLTRILSEIQKVERTHRCWSKMQEISENFFRYKNGKQETYLEVLQQYIQKNLEALTIKEENQVIDEKEAWEEKTALSKLRMIYSYLSGNQIREEKEIYEKIQEENRYQKEKWVEEQQILMKQITYAIHFMTEMFPSREELLSFLAGISTKQEVQELEQKEEMEMYRNALLLLEIDYREQQIKSFI